MSSPPHQITTHTVIGTPFSTFTRTITLALHYKAIPFAQVPVFPHSPTADANHPFGFIPTLIIHGGNVADSKEGNDGKQRDDMKLGETQAIVRYIDRIAPEPTLHLRSKRTERKGDMVEEKMWEYISFITSYGFQAIEYNLIKPRLFYLSSGLSPDTTSTLLSPAILRLTHFLTLTSALISRNTPFLFSKSHPTWADFYLFPILADLCVTPEWASVVLPHSIGERLEEWMRTMEALECVRETREGTLSAGAGMEEQLAFYAQVFPRVPEWYRNARAAGEAVKHC